MKHLGTVQPFFKITVLNAVINPQKYLHLSSEGEALQDRVLQQRSKGSRMDQMKGCRKMFWTTVDMQLVISLLSLG